MVTVHREKATSGTFGYHWDQSRPMAKSKFSPSAELSSCIRCKHTVVHLLCIEEYCGGGVYLQETLFLESLRHVLKTRNINFRF